MKLNLKFYPNTKDNTHCVQALMKSILKKIYPKRNFTLDELEKISGKRKGKYTSMPGTVVGLKRLGLKVHIFGSFDYNQFVKYGSSYWRDNFSKEVSETQIETSDINSEVEDAKEMLKFGIFKKKKIRISDLGNFLEDGWFVMAHVNINLLNGKAGYSGHAVLITGFDKDYIWFHDPGLPPVQNRKETKKFFMQAFDYGGICEIYLVRK